MKKRLLYFLIAVIICTILFSIISFAHSGKTDSSGGHYDRSTGEYHYHHGYPAHQHTNGECPYDFKDNTNHQSGHKSSSTSFGNIVGTIFTSLGLSITITFWLWAPIWAMIDSLFKKLLKKELPDNKAPVFIFFTFICIFIITFYIIFTN